MEKRLLVSTAAGSLKKGGNQIGKSFALKVVETQTPLLNSSIKKYFTWFLEQILLRQ